MPRMLLLRVLSGLAVVLGVLTLMFFLLRLAPGDPARLLVGPAATEAQGAAQRRGAGLGRFAQGDWGTSLATGRPVRDMLGGAWPATVRLVGLSLVLSYVLGIAVGVVQAMRGGGPDTAPSGISVPL